jgi:hypothetical protein
LTGLVYEACSVMGAAPRAVVRLREVMDGPYRVPIGWQAS